MGTSTHPYHHRCWLLNFVLKTIWMFLFLFSRKDLKVIISINNLKRSHWINMDILLQALHSRGHNITIVRSDKSWYIKDKSTYYRSFTVEVKRSLDQKYITELVSKAILFERGALPLTNFLHMTLGMFSTFVDAHMAVGEFVSAMLSDQELMRTLRDSKFDLVLTDPCWGGGVILAKYLNLPLVYNVRWLIAGEAHLAIAPSPLSYIPITGSGNTDKMTFFQRVKNVFLHLVTQTQHHLVVRQVYQKICDKYLGPDNDYHQLMLDADIWLMRVDFVFEFPRPTMPNAVYMGGFQCKPAKRLLSTSLVNFNVVAVWRETNNEVSM
uniref:UDP glucuronosyltransferase 5 family, polypeptide D1 n=1 Tax=Mola mola TaxID=94237 RepID=A0A3Q3VPF2_MOLML